ncbi:hypothetical protein C8N43_2163 [Litoreibacter ponti]|uniref:Peptidoglycan binding protein n=1 Tax=Litoreibacter ponti TaxID=1510457 RepID=A0A2T6BN37_9RHOB|nr:hypothetical protein [Litoreibacter ponti]PTX57493.1 hypothetical protein C8N43_2163 [Litoreibacter ponti]
MLRFALVAASLALATPSFAAPNQQLVNSVQHRLNSLGFQAVDAGSLSGHQIAALHLALQGRIGFGPNRIRKQQEVKNILNWNGQERTHSINKSN